MSQRSRPGSLQSQEIKPEFLELFRQEVRDNLIACQVLTCEPLTFGQASIIVACARGIRAATVC